MRLPELEVEARDDMARAVLADSLERYDQAQVRVSGDCMSPTLETGDRVTLATSRERRPRLGDVVLARGPEGLRLHRLIWGPPLARRRWRTGADAASALDPWWIRPEDVLAVVTEKDDRPFGSSPWRAAVALLRSLLA